MKNLIFAAVICVSGCATATASDNTEDAGLPAWTRSIEVGHTRCVGRLSGGEEICYRRLPNGRLVEVSRPERDPDRRRTFTPR